MHDATEGGIYGALYECLAPLKIGCHIESEKIPLNTVTKQISEDLGINPFKLISSGTVIVICSKDKGKEILQFLNETKETPATIIGETTKFGSPLLVDGKELLPPSADEVISGLTFLSSEINT